MHIPVHHSWRVLDVGSGTGVIRRQLQHYASWIIDGADIDLQVLMLNHDNSGITMPYDILDRREEFRAKYDALIIFDVIEHIKHPEDFLRAAAFHLKPNGYLFLNVPAIDALRGKYDRAVGHLHRYNKQQISSLLTSSGFRTVDLRYWGLTLLPLLLIRNMLLRKDMSVAEIITRGMNPPSVWVNWLMLRILSVETSILRNPLIGASLLALGRKPPQETTKTEDSDGRL